MDNAIDTQAASVEAMSKLSGSRVVFSGGGTGGHLYPLLAVAELWRERYDGNVLFMGTVKGLEHKVVPERGFRFQAICARGLAGGVLGKIKALLALGVGIAQSWSVLRSFRPRVVIGSGGYVCAPVLMAARLLRIPTVLMEQNAKAGKTVRLLARCASRVCTCWPEAAQGLPAAKVVLTGNPVRQEVISEERAKARQRYQLPEGRPCLLITGASQGAASINSAVLKALPQWREREWTVIHLTGPKHIDKIKAEAEPLVAGGKLDYRPLGYLEDMAGAYAACDLVVCRAGATTLAEVTARGIAALLVPYPFAAENHQVANAQSLVNNGAGVMIADDQVEERLGTAVPELLEQPDRLLAMAQASAAMGRPQAAEDVLRVVAESI